jgi:sirohydrochlorin cobaltochelatase
MTAPANPALEAFIRFLKPEKIWGEVLIQSAGLDYTLRHVADRDLTIGQLKRLSISEARKFAMFNTAGQFRPLRSSPDLARNWVIVCSNPNELWRALQELYPGSVPDWFAAQAGALPTNYREFTNRQSGMYRIASMLTDAQAANVTRAACHTRFCLKRRLWTVPGLEPDSTSAKSQIPCLEPCAVLLELARKATRIEQEDKLSVQLSRSELESLLAAAESVVSSGLATDRIGNIGSATNPRRLQLLLEKFKEELRPAEKPSPDNES